jgi:hypothetical protein
LNFPAHRIRLTATSLCPFLVLLLVGSTIAKASTPTVGVGDNNWPMFNDPNHRALKTKISRKVISYDFYHHADQRADLAAWMNAAELAGIRPLVAFNFSERNPRHLPSVGAFAKSVRYLKSRYPELRDFSPWNEANHRSQPTHRNPLRAAQYYNVSRRICRGCRIVAADVLDQANMLPWIAAFRRRARRPRLWGIHSYRDVNRNVPWRRSALRRLLRVVPGRIWMTEVGGLVAFARTYSYSERRGVSGLKTTLRYAQASRRVERVYLYCWYGSPQAHRKPYLWDSGLVAANSKPRPAYFTLRRWLRAHRRALTLR